MSVSKSRLDIEAAYFQPGDRDGDWYARTQFLAINPLPAANLELNENMILAYGPEIRSA